MKKVVRKLFWAWQFEEEEKWLDEMANDGWALCGVGWCKYIFEPCEKGEYRFKLEYLANRAGHSESVKYISFIEETGAEYIGNYLHWVYFRQKSEKGKFEILSSRATRIKHMESITGLLSGFAIVNVIIGVINVFISLFNHSSFNMIGIVNLIIAGFLYSGYKKINAQCQRLIQEKAIFED